MFDLYTKFLIGVIVPREGEKEISGLSGQFTTFIPNLLKVFEKAETIGCLTENLACQHISFYLHLGRLDEARKLTEKLCHEKFSDSIRLWLLKASLEIRQRTRDSISPTKADLLSVYLLIKNVLAKASISEAEGLWLMVRHLYFLPLFTYFCLLLILVEIQLFLLYYYSLLVITYKLSYILYTRWDKVLNLAVHVLQRCQTR